MGKGNTSRRLWAVLAVAGVVVLASGVAYAAIPSSGGRISGCYDRANGRLRLIDAEAGQTCNRNEAAISWTQSARLACPSGTTLSTGVCIEDSARAAARHSDAEDDCSDEGRRLPSPGELNTFRDIPGVTLSTGGEWSDDLGDTEGTFRYFVITDNGNGVLPASESVAYRCVAGAGIA